MVRATVVFRSLYVALVALLLAAGACLSCSDDDGAERRPGEPIAGSDVRFEDLKGRWVEFHPIASPLLFAAIHVGTARELRDIYGTSFSAALTELAERTPAAPIVIQAYSHVTRFTVSHFRMRNGRLDLSDVVGSGPQVDAGEHTGAPYLNLFIESVNAEQSFVASAISNPSSSPDSLRRWDRTELCAAVDSRTGWALFPAPTAVVDDLGNVWGLGATVLWTSLGTVGSEFFMPVDGCGFVIRDGAPELLHPILVAGDQLYAVGSTIAGEFGEVGTDTVVIATRPRDGEEWISHTEPLSDFEGCAFSKLVAHEVTGAMTFCLRDDGALRMLTIAADGSTSFQPLSSPPVAQFDPARTYVSSDGTILSTAFAGDPLRQEFSSLLLALPPGATQWSMEEVPVPFLSWIGPIRKTEDGAYLGFTRDFHHAGGVHVSFAYGLLEYRDGAISATRVGDWTGGFRGEILPDGTAVFSLGDASSLTSPFPTRYNFAGVLDLDGRYDAGNFKDNTTTSDTTFSSPFPPSPQIPPIPGVSGSPSGFVAIWNGYGVGYVKPPRELTEREATLTLEITGMPEGATVTVGTGVQAEECSESPCEVRGLIASALVPVRVVLPAGFALMQQRARRANEESHIYGEPEPDGDAIAYYLWISLVNQAAPVVTDDDSYTDVLSITEVAVAEIASETRGNDEYWISNHSFAEKTAVLHAHERAHAMRGDDGLPVVYPAGTQILRRIDVATVQWETVLKVSTDAQVAISQTGSVVLLSDSGTVGENNWNSKPGRATLAHFSSADGSLDQTHSIDLGGVPSVELIGCAPSGLVYVQGRSSGPVAALGLTAASDFVAAFRKEGTRAWTWSRELPSGPVFVKPPQVLVDDSEIGDVAVVVLLEHPSSSGTTNGPFEILGLDSEGDAIDSFDGTFSERADLTLSLVRGGPVLSLLAPNGAIDLDGQLIGATTTAQSGYVIGFDWNGSIRRSFQTPNVSRVEDVSQFEDGRFVVAGSGIVSVEGDGVLGLDRGTVEHVHALDNGDLLFVYIAPVGLRYSVRRLNPSGFSP